MRCLHVIDQGFEHKARIRIARGERVNDGDVDFLHIGAAIGDEQRSRESRSLGGPAQRAQRQRVIDGVDAAKRYAGKIEHGLACAVKRAK